jgi:hypothetical protein
MVAAERRREAGKDFPLRKTELAGVGEMIRTTKGAVRYEAWCQGEARRLGCAVRYTTDGKRCCVAP